MYSRKKSGGERTLIFLISPCIQQLTQRLEQILRLHKQQHNIQATRLPRQKPTHGSQRHRFPLFTHTAHDLNDSPYHRPRISFYSFNLLQQPLDPIRIVRTARHKVVQIILARHRQRAQRQLSQNPLDIFLANDTVQRAREEELLPQVHWEVAIEEHIWVGARVVGVGVK